MGYRPRLSLLPLLAALSAVLCVATPASAKGGKEAARAPEWTEEDGRTVLRVFSPSPLKAYFAAPTTALEAGKTAEMIVVLHGHGGTATGLLGYVSQLPEASKAFILACEGSGTAGTGHAWGSPDAQGILACVEAALSSKPVDAKRVVLMGHSAGGSMSLRTYAAKPTAFAGVYTTAAPETPSSAHKGARIVVNLGTTDGNFAGFGAAVSAAEKTVTGRVVAVINLGHDLPDTAYSQEAISWLLDSKGTSDVLHVPLRPADDVLPPPDSPASKAKGKTFRHALVFQAGGRGAPADALPRAEAKAKAAEIAARWKKAPPASLGDLVAADSADPLSKDLRGVVTGAVLARYGLPLVTAISKMKGGDVVGPLEGDAGWHVVTRDP